MTEQTQNNMQQIDQQLQKTEQHQTFETEIKFIQIGKALCVDLKSSFSKIKIEVKTPHMTVLFDSENKFAKDKSVVQQLEENTQQFLQSKGQKTVKFTLSPWGRRSDLIHGELYDLCVFLREQFYKVKHSELKQCRPPHVELRK